jgi:dolichyl-phosphate beta-glucosyltransferase
MHVSSALDVSLVVPCFNEARRFDADAFARALAQWPWLHLQFVDDGSTDATASVLARFVGEHMERADLLVLPRNEGKAEAVRQGLLHVLHRGGLCGFWDADLSATLDEVAPLRDVLARRPEVQWVWGIRLRALGREVQRRALRHYLGRLFATTASLLLKIDSYDTQCGAKLFRAAPLLATAISVRFESRWIFDVELLTRADMLLQHAGASGVQAAVYEQPLGAWRHRAGSKVRTGDFVRALQELWRVRAARAAWRRELLPPPATPYETVRPSSPAMTAP